MTAPSININIVWAEEKWSCVLDVLDTPDLEVELFSGESPNGAMTEATLNFILTLVTKWATDRSYRLVIDPEGWQTATERVRTAHDGLLLVVGEQIITDEPAIIDLDRHLRDYFTDKPVPGMDRPARLLVWVSHIGPKVLTLPGDDHPMVEGTMLLAMAVASGLPITAVLLLLEAWTAEDDGSGRTPTQRHIERDPTVSTAFLAALVRRDLPPQVVQAVQRIGDAGEESLGPIVSIEPIWESEQAREFRQAAETAVTA